LEFWLQQCCLLLFSQGTYAQTRVLKGRVLDESNNSPLPGANVVVAGSVQGTTTDANGTFSLTVPTNAQQLVISFVGYVRKEIQITNAEIILLPWSPMKVP
jgi:hypothetical protein